MKKKTEKFVTRLGASAFLTASVYQPINHQSIHQNN